MSGTPRLIVGTVVIGLLAAGVGWAIQSTRGPAFASPEAAMAGPGWQEGVAGSDSTVLGGIAYRECRSAGEPCYHAFLLSLADDDRITLAMGALSVIGGLDDRVRRNGHPYAHAIGMRGYNPDRDFGELFLSCTAAFQSGCYHGLIQVHLTRSELINPDHISDFCDRIPGLDTDYWLRFQCAHGLGHGLLMATNHDLPRGLAACDYLRSGWDRESCYGGAFMENVIATETHHMPVRASAATAMDSAAREVQEEGHAGHEEREMEEMAPAFPRINPEDPYYPCSILHEHYQPACYGMQTSLMLELTEYDWRETAILCDGAPEAWRTVCYQSLGTNISGNTVRNARESVRLCSLGNRNYQPWCFFGVAKNFIDVSSLPSDGIAFCRVVPAGPNRLKCYQAVGEELAVLFHDQERRVGVCEAIEGEDGVACRFGAGLTSAPPPDLPLIPGIS